jgi:hypothetical protein
MSISIDIFPGELLDRMSILAIKLRRPASSEIMAIRSRPEDER